MRRRRPIYVETVIRTSMDELWAATQDPELHRRWDVRFSEISYLSRIEGRPQSFTYATTVAPGVTIAGTGESLGDRNRPDGTHWSGLKFWSDDRRSIIEAGAGFWRYVPTEDGIRFLTRFDYRPRWGVVGEVLDRHVVRPAFGRSTAWSFDRLRLWLEAGIPPERSRDQAIAHATAVSAIVAIWIYQGLVPKLLAADEGELAPWRALGLGESAARAAVRLAGVLEVAAGVVIARNSTKRWPFVANAVAMPLLALGVARTDRPALSRAFNPMTLNAAVAALAVVALVTSDDLPSGGRPLRHAPDAQPDVGDLP